MMVVKESSYADGRIQAQISMKSHNFLRNHKQGTEPLYKVLDRILSMYKFSNMEPLEREIKLLHESLEHYKHRAKEDEKTIKTCNEKIKYYEEMVKELEEHSRTKKLTEFLE